MPRPKIPPKLREEVIQRDGLFCRYCGTGPMSVQWDYNRKGKVRLYNAWNRLGDPTIELDHLIPLSRGGENTAENLVVSCRSCNGRKWNRNLYAALRQPIPFSLLPRPSAEALGWRRTFYRGFP